MNYTLDQIIRSFINETGEPSAKYFRMLSVAWAGIEELNMDVSGIPTVTLLTIDETTCRADLPEDYLNYKRIGVCIGGRVVDLGRDDTLCLNRVVDDCGDQQAIPVTPDPRDSTAIPFNGVPLPMDFWWGGNGGMFGLGAGNNKNGYYRIDKENDQILFASSVSGTIVLEYLSTPKKNKGEFVVHPYCVEALKAFIEWRMTNKKQYMGAWQISRTEYYNQRRLAKARFDTFTLGEIYQALNKSFMQAPKY